jgi:hypothetical protein
MKLNGCINDINNMKTFLETRLGYNRFSILTDDTPVKPTKVNILNAINVFVRSLRPGDEAWFHYSGHGILVNDVNRDEESGFDSCIAPLDFMRTGFISDDVIRSNLVQRVPRGVKVYIVLDACHSGTGCDLRYKYDDSSYIINQGANPRTYVPSDWILRQTLTEFKRYGKIAGEVYCISGCQDNQKSGDAYIESEKMYGGVLTSIMLSLFKSNDLRVYKWKHLLKDICCSEKVQGHAQRTAITSGNSLNMESSIFNISISNPIPKTNNMVSIPIINKSQPLKRGLGMQSYSQMHSLLNKNRNAIKKMIFT